MNREKIYIVYAVDGPCGNIDRMDKRVEYVVYTEAQALEKCQELSKTLDERYSIEYHEWEMDADRP